MTKAVKDVLLEVQHLKTYYPIHGGFFRKKIGDVKAVDGISFAIRKGETLGLVGESGCGKSTAGRTILRLLEPTSGKIIFDGKDITEAKGTSLRKIRQDFQMVFKIPMLPSTQCKWLEMLFLNQFGILQENQPIN